MGILARPPMTLINYFPITIFLSLLLICQFGASYGMIRSCITNYTETVNNQTHLVDDPYRNNLLSLFSSLTASSSSFYNTTAGESPDKGYGLYLCRGDATSDICRTCVTSLTSWLSTQSDCREGAAFMDDCMIHYANYSFFGKANDRVLGAQVGKFAATLSLQYNQTLDGVLEGVITDAASSTTSYATREGVFMDQGEQETVYGLAQCTPDIDRSGCSGCLKAAQSYLQGNITGVAKSAWALLPSCQLRYDNATFYGVSPANSNSAPPTVSAFLVATLILFFVNWLV